MRCQYCDYTCANAVPDLKLHMKRKHLKQHPDDPPSMLDICVSILSVTNVCARDGYRVQLLIVVCFWIVLSIYRNTELLTMTGKLYDGSIEDIFSDTIIASL